MNGDADHDHDLTRAREGDAAAEARLVERHTPALRRYLRRRMGIRLARSVSVGDLLQEAFLRVFRALPSLPPDATERLFRAWLYRHADWVLANHGRAAQQHFGESAAGGTVPDLPARDAQGSAGGVTRADDVAHMAALLQRLEPGYRSVVALRLEGRSFAAIAQQLGIEEATARQRHARVMRGLRERLGGAD
jgi:RNA polymerase sigma factor (sigma-70 family)